MSDHENERRVTIIRKPGYKDIKVIEKTNNEGEDIVIVKIGGEERYRGTGSPKCDPGEEDC